MEHTCSWLLHGFVLFITNYSRVKITEVKHRTWITHLGSRKMWLTFNDIKGRRNNSFSVFVCGKTFVRVSFIRGHIRYLTNPSPQTFTTTSLVFNLSFMVVNSQDPTCSWCSPELLSYVMLYLSSVISPLFLVQVTSGVGFPTITDLKTTNFPMEMATKLH